MAEQLGVFSREGIAEWERIRRKVDTLRGDGVTNTRDAISICNPVRKPTDGQRSPGIAGLFPVKVQKDGGSDGSASTAASWTYTVRDLGGNTLGTTIAVVCPRPNGKMTYQSGSSGYGLAFYDGGTLKLWSAGETETTGACT